MSFAAYVSLEEAGEFAEAYEKISEVGGHVTDNSKFSISHEPTIPAGASGPWLVQISVRGHRAFMELMAHMHLEMPEERVSATTGEPSFVQMVSSAVDSASDGAIMNLMNGVNNAVTNQNSEENQEDDSEDSEGSDLEFDDDEDEDGEDEEDGEEFDEEDLDEDGDDEDEPEDDDDSENEKEAVEADRLVKLKRPTISTKTRNPNITLQQS